MYTLSVYVGQRVTLWVYMYADRQCTCTPTYTDSSGMSWRDVQLIPQTNIQNMYVLTHTLAIRVSDQTTG